MKITYKVIYNGNPVENYDLSVEGFFHNDNIVLVDNKVNHLLNLYNYIKDWEKITNKYLNTGFYVCLESNKGNYEYFFENEMPGNFSAFVCDIKRIFKEEK